MTHQCNSIATAHGQTTRVHLCVCVTQGGSGVAWCGRYASPAVGASVCMPTFSAQTQQTLTQIAEGEVRNSQLAPKLRGMCPRGMCVGACARARVCVSRCVCARVCGYRYPQAPMSMTSTSGSFYYDAENQVRQAVGRTGGLHAAGARTHGVAWDRACSTSRYAHLGFSHAATPCTPRARSAPCRR